MIFNRHPALYQKLTVPMVDEKSKHLLSEVYRGRLDGDLGDTGAFSDVYTMKRMSKEHPGKASAAPAPFEFVSENDMDFENFKDRPEFGDDAGDVSVYGGNISRPGTPGSAFGDSSQRGRSVSRNSERSATADEPGVTYPAGYHHTPSALREYSPSPSPDPGHRNLHSSSSTPYQVHDDRNLLAGAAPMGGTGGYTPYSPEREGQGDYFRR